MEPSTTRQVHRVETAGAPVADTRLDELAVEEPLELATRVRSLAVIMRTPGHDLELANGFLQSEGVLRGDEVGSLELDSEEANRILLDMDEDRLQERWADRQAITSSACGVCGASALAVLDSIATPSRSPLQVDAEFICKAPERLRDQQEVFAKTGGLHGAALLDSSGALVVCREDVGRHNAVDKLFGWARLSQRSLEDTAMVVSGRLSYEIVHKAVVARVPILIAVSAPSSLAVDLAERWRITLAGFVRGSRFNIYSHPQRVRIERGR